jgi:hypothetical protein
MADGGVIQEFLVGLGFKIDETSQKRFAEATTNAAAGVAKLQAQAQAAAKGLQDFAKGLGETAAAPMRKYDEATRKLAQRHAEMRKGVVELGRAAVVTATTFAAGILQVAKNYEQLFYISQQTGSSVADLSKLSFGFSQIGIAGEQALGLMQRMALAMKAQPGLQGFLGNLIGPQDVQRLAGNLGTIRDQTGAFLKLIDRLATMAPAIRAQIGQMFGIPQDVLEQAIANRDTLRKAYEEYGQLLDKAGVNQDAFAKQSRDFMNLLGKLWSEFSLVLTQAAVPIVKALTPVLATIDQLLQDLLQFNAAMPGAAIAETFTVMALGATTLLGAFGLMTRGFGVMFGPLRTLIAILGVLSTALEGLGLAMGLLNPAVLILVGGATLIATHWTELSNAFSEIAANFDKALAQLGKGFATLYDDYIGPVVNKIKAAWEWLFGASRQALPIPPRPPVETAPGAPGAQPGPPRPPVETAPGAPGAQPGPPRPTGQPGEFSYGGQATEAEKGFSYGGPATEAEKSFSYGGAPARYQEGGIVRIDAHDQEMVLPANISRGLQRLYSGAETGRGPVADIGADRTSERLGDWLQGSTGTAPRVEVANVDDFTQEQMGAGERLGRAIGGTVGGWIGGAQGAAAGQAAGGAVGRAADTAIGGAKTVLDKVMGGGEGTGAKIGPIADPRYAAGGSRAFNYGNIGVTHGRERAFGSAQEGLLALQQNLLAYQEKHNVNTLGGIISRWSPPEENPTAELIRNAAQRTGLDPSQPLDLHDPAVMRKITEAIIVQEHSRIPPEAAKALVEGSPDKIVPKVTPGFGGPAPVAGEIPKDTPGAMTQETLQADFAKRSGVFGTPQEAAHHLTTIAGPSGAKFTVNERAAAQFQGLINELGARGYNIDPRSSGGYNPRQKVGSSGWSEHAYGTAIDINPEQNPQGRGPLKTDLPADVGDIAAKYGIKWGGTFHGLKDPMHFEIAKLLEPMAAASSKLEGAASKLEGAPLTSSNTTTNGGDTITHEGDKNVSMNVTHNTTIEGGTAADQAARYTGANKRLYGDMMRDLKGGMLT